MEEGWKEVFQAGLEYKAEMAKEILENNGIKVVVLNQHDTAFQGFGTVRIFVREEKMEQALKLLEKLKN